MEKLNKLLQEIYRKMNIHEEVNLKIVPMKQKLASLSFRTKILRLNSNLLDILNEKEIEFILIHELVHLKIKDINHGSLFINELKNYTNLDDAKNIELKIIEKLLYTQK